MDVNNEESARKWLNVWGNKLTPSMLKIAIEGLSTARNIMSASRYSDARRDAMDAAIAVLVEHAPINKKAHDARMAECRAQYEANWML